VLLANVMEGTPPFAKIPCILKPLKNIAVEKVVKSAVVGDVIDNEVAPLNGKTAF
jgi:hypothetical protein